MPGRAVHHHGQFPVWKEGAQDAPDFLLSELQIVNDPRHDLRLRLQRRGTREVQRNLAVQGRLRLEDAEQHFSEPHQGVSSAMW